MSGFPYSWTPAQQQFAGTDPAYQKYFMSAYPWADSYEDIGAKRQTGGLQAIEKYRNYWEPMSYQEWKALTGGGGWQNPSTPPVTPPTPSDNLLGLMKQSADPWGTYGQMGVNEPYLSNINNRFGWSPQGLAYPTQLQASPTWYNPPIVYPDVVQPPLKTSGTSSSTSSTTPWVPGSTYPWTPGT